jgi:hypothetical protein
MSPLALTFRRIVLRLGVVNWHLLRALLAHRLGRLVEARRHLRRVLDIDADHFRARVTLGRIHFQVLEIREGLAHLYHARRVDPDRFRRSGLEEYLDSYGHDDSAGEPSGAPVLSLSPLDHREPSSPRRLAREADPVGSKASTPASPSPRPADDFSSWEETERFRDLPAITRDDIEQIDWDRIDPDLFD